MKGTLLSAQRGAALALVLWAVFVLTTVLIVTLSLVDFDIDLEGIAAKRFRARQAALTGVAYASHPKVERGDPLLWREWQDGTRIEVDIESEDARLNINQLLARGNTAALVKLFRFWGVSEQEASAAADSLKDWVDGDDFRRLHGAERADLPEGSPYSRPENRPFQTVAEMRAVRGMDVVAAVRPDWEKYFSVHSSGALSLRDAPADFLQVFGLLDTRQAEALVAFRKGADGKSGNADDPKLEAVDAAAAIVSLGEAQMAALRASFRAGSAVRRIVSRGYCGAVVCEISAVVKGTSEEGYLAWAEK
jgi:type II secretory pathway component PulK